MPAVCIAGIRAVVIAHLRKSEIFRGRKANLIMVITQIYSPVSSEEALKLVELGTDYIGTVTRFEIPAGPRRMLSKDQVKEIFDVIRGKAACVLIPMEPEPKQRMELCLYTGAEIVQNVSFSHEQDVEFFRLRNEKMPQLKIMKSIYVRDGGSVRAAFEAEPFCDLILLDSPKEGGGGGATGKTHDWSLSKQIIDGVHLPVILAGGLGPDNVAEAIEALHPFGVDALTKVSVYGEDGTLLGKDLGKVAEFNRIAHTFE